MSTNLVIRYGVIGIDHPHIYGQVKILEEAGAEFVSFFAQEPALIARFRATYPDIPLARSADEILEDDSLQLIVSAGIPCERAPLGIRAMQHGKDYMTDKPGITTLEQLAEVRRVQAETDRIYSIDYSERFHNRAAVKAAELVQAGAIGRVIQVVILAPHHRRFHTRPDWFFHREKYGGILVDIGSHQFDQVLHFTGSTQAEIVTSQVANFYHPETLGFEDFGDAVVRGNGGLGYVRVDWFTPEGLGVWGDGRLTILGSEGYIEARKYVDLSGRPGGDHVFLVDHGGTQYMDCKDVELTYGRQLLYDIQYRTETAMSQEHCFLTSELAIEAEAQAARLGYLQDA